MENNGEIYCLTSPSGKKYVGQCVKQLSSGKKWGYIQRWKDHIRDANSKNYCNELDKIKAFIMKYIIEHSKKPITNISITKFKKSVISTFISLFQRNVLYPLSNM